MKKKENLLSRYEIKFSCGCYYQYAEYEGNTREYLRDGKSRLALTRTGLEPSLSKTSSDPLPSAPTEETETSILGVPKASTVDLVCFLGF